eukprot:3532963-Amphidinium_carterae.2
MPTRERSALVVLGRNMGRVVSVVISTRKCRTTSQRFEVRKVELQEGQTLQERQPDFDLETTACKRSKKSELTKALTHHKKLPCT